MSKRTQLLHKLKHVYSHNTKLVLDVENKDIELIIEALEKHTWISVEDRLPKNLEIGEGGFIVQEKDVCEPFSAYWDGERWTDSNCEPIDDVIAWMPLPKPYKKGEC